MRQGIRIARRSFSNTARNDIIDFSKLTIEKSKALKPKVPLNDLVFGRYFTDHMMSVDWSSSNGWEAPKIIPYQNLSISPAASALHYGIECFEGMKAYKTSNGEIRLFRPDCNMDRLKYSMERLSLPSINTDGLLDCIKELLRVDESWIPSEEGYSMYIRPTAIGTSPFLGVQAAEHCKVYCILSPVGPYYRGGFNPIKLYADTDNVRAWPGGAGNAKVGGNYAPTILPSKKAQALGCSQILWLFGKEHYATEVGAMNMFFFLRKPNGGTELVTAPLSNGDILPGVTRRSILELTRDWNEFEVNERWISLKEIQEAAKSGRLIEAFGAGTAVVISPVRGIMYQGEEITIPVGEGQGGDLSLRLWKALYNIQYGKVDHPWSVAL